MRAYIALQAPPKWIRDLGLKTSALLPIANTTVLDHWLRFCLVNEISDVWFIGSKYQLSRVWEYAADGHRWGLGLRYRCEANASSVKVITSDPLCLRAGGAWLSTNFFPQFGAVGVDCALPRCAALTGAPANPTNIWCPTADCVDDLLHKRISGWSMSRHGMRPARLKSAKAFLEHTHRHLDAASLQAKGEGFIRIGYNSRVASSSQLRGPVLIGNNCRIEPGCKIGPGVVIGDHCVIEAKTTIIRSCVLPDTYLSPGLVLHNKVARANAIVSERGAFVDPAQELCAAFTPLKLGARSRRTA
jgi:hypothetical protein